MSKGPVIAERELSSSIGSISLILYAPLLGDMGWKCDFEVEWPDKSIAARSFGGADALDSLLYAIRGAQLELSYSDSKPDDIQWLGSDNLGFQFMFPVTGPE